MNFCVRPIQKAFDFRRFERVPNVVYRDDPNWVPDMPGAIKGQLGPESKFLQYGRFQAFLAQTDNGELLGRIVASVNSRLCAKEGKQIGSFGYFETIHNHDISDALFDAATTWLIEQGCVLGRGPIDLSTHIGGLTLVDGFDEPAYIRMPYNPSYYPSLIESAGWHGVRDAFAFDFAMEPLAPAFERAYRLALRAGITFRAVHTKGEAMRSDLRAIHGIFATSFEDNWSATERDVSEFVDEAEQMRHIIDPRLFPVAEYNGKVVGFWLGLPDINRALRASRGWPTPLVFAHLLWKRRRLDSARVLAVAILPEFQKPRYALGPALVYLGMDGGASGGHPYQRAELSWVWENNARSLGLIRGAAGRHYKTYRMFERTLDGRT